MPIQTHFYTQGKEKYKKYDHTTVPRKLTERIIQLSVMLRKPVSNKRILFPLKIISFQTEWTEWITEWIKISSKILKMLLRCFLFSQIVSGSLKGIFVTRYDLFGFLIFTENSRERNLVPQNLKLLLAYQKQFRVRNTKRHIFPSKKNKNFPRH